MTVFWTDAAYENLLAIRDYLAQTSPTFAEQMVDRLLRRSDQIGRFPQAGRVIPEYQRADLREVVERPYRVMYRILADRVDVLALLHSAQQLPPDL